MLGGHARVDRTPQHLPFRFGHRCTFCRARRERPLLGLYIEERQEVLLLPC